ncbi:type II toxin-antitoxin system HicA family toxin [Bradyrhizobium sp. USDA 372]
MSVGRSSAAGAGWHRTDFGTDDVKSVSGREFARIVERHGWSLLRVSGSHHIYGKPGSIVRLSVPIHGNKPLKTGSCVISSRWLSYRTTIYRLTS